MYQKTKCHYCLQNNKIIESILINLLRLLVAISECFLKFPRPPFSKIFTTLHGSSIFVRITINKNTQLCKVINSFNIHL